MVMKASLKVRWPVGIIFLPIIVQRITFALKGFKVTDSGRSRTYGIACRTLDELKTKASTKFKIPLDEISLCLSDGTLVDSTDYMETLPCQTLLICSKSSEPVVTGADIIYTALMQINRHLIDAGASVEDFMQSDLKGKMGVLSELTKKVEGEEEEFHEWIKGTETNSKTKEAFMESRCRDRIRNYFYKAVSDLRASPQYSVNRNVLDHLIAHLREDLRRNKFEGIYFNRKHPQKSYCDSKGVFSCAGVWNKPSHNAGAGHKINPYLSRESRIIFSTWNLDHRVERSRSIVPAVLKTVSDLPPSTTVNHTYVYELLFTRNNLRLVHVVCHDKGSHSFLVPDMTKMIKVFHQPTKIRVNS